MTYESIREKVYTTIMKSCDAGLIRLSAGNISARTEDGLVAITPTSIKYDVLRPQDISIVDLNGNLVDGSYKPSSEMPMHTTFYRGLPNVGAVCHMHSPFAITFAALGKEIPMISLELYTCGAPIPVVRWACPGTSEAGEVALEVFKSRPELKICLLRNHGLVAIGKDLDNAFELAYDAEIGMQIYHETLQIGQPEIMTEDYVKQIRAAYA